jgi:pSer/pThr/pTyr-binding forkhead associated (FHA) protein
MRALALATDETLLVLKIAFLVLLYGFILYVVRTATKDFGGAPQESIVLGAAEANALRAEHGAQIEAGPARFVVLDGPGLKKGRTLEVSATTVLGRDGDSDLALADDDFASGRHARIDPRTDGVWVEDLGSTNGTFVNGDRITAERLNPGDVLRVGQTELRLET